MDKNVGIKIGKKILIIFFISLIIELGIMFYNIFVNKIYTKFHLLGNDSIEISKQDLNFETVDGITSINVKNVDNTIIYNISLVLNSGNTDVYMRVIMNDDAKFIPKENASASKFKVYYFNGVLTNEFSIVYGEGSVNSDSIEKVIINDNIDYMPQRRFSFVQFLTIFIALEIVNILISLYKISKNNDRKIKKEFLFLGASLIIGITFIFINVPQIRYDEHAHFWRTYEIASGNIISRTTNKLPESVIELFKREDGSYPNKEFNYETVKEKEIIHGKSEL